MILADTSIWIDHLRRSNALLTELLAQDRVMMHPFVIGEVALGGLRERSEVLAAMQRLLEVTVATDSEVLQLIDRQNLAGSGIGYVDAHLLASVMLTGRARLWTRDRRLSKAAVSLGLAAEE